MADHPVPASGFRWSISPDSLPAPAVNHPFIFHCPNRSSLCFRRPPLSVRNRSMIPNTARLCSSFGDTTPRARAFATPSHAAPHISRHRYSIPFERANVRAARQAIS